MTRPSTAAAGGFRPDVEGLRAVALAVVLLTHAGVSFVQGGYAGVDVFFVISGYLITRMILGEIGRSGRVSLVGFYARRAKRLLPLALQAGYVVTLRRLLGTGAEVVVLGDTPRAPIDVPECVSRSMRRLSRCAFDERRATRRPLVNERAARSVPGVRLLHPRRMLCPDSLCPAVVGDVLVYRDSHHLTASYARTLTPWLDRRLRALQVPR